VNKDELIKENKKLLKLLEDEQKNSDAILRQVKEMKRLAEEAGSEMSKWKHQCLRLEEKVSKLKNR
jgi:hypothetical protein